jgi:hypothetical protein
MQITDFGDAPEMVLAYPGVVGRFPTCRAASPPGTQELAVPPISTPPGPTGFIEHLQFGGGTNYWLGPFLSSGIDSEEDGKVNQPPVGFSFCSGVPTDCIGSDLMGPGPLSWDQDECIMDGDASPDFVLCGGSGPFLPECVSDPRFRPCAMNSLLFHTSNCGPSRQVYLNICLDMNGDGDWNDNFLCEGGLSAYEWAVKNQAISIPETYYSPAFRVGPNEGLAWLRISLTDEPVPDDYPWAGGIFAGGETEDFAWAIADYTPTRTSTWGQLKAMYR